MLDTDWSPFNDSIVASAGDDGKAMISKVDATVFEEWGRVPQDFDSVAPIDVTLRRVGQSMFHLTAEHMLATATGEHTVQP